MQLTENAWRRGLTPSAALELLPDARPRQWRLFACACLRLCGDHLTHPAGRQAVEVLEAMCDGRARRADLTAAVGEVRAALMSLPPAWHPSPSDWALSAAQFLDMPRPQEAAARMCIPVVECLTAARTARGGERRAAMTAAHGAIRAVMHDVFGNPFRPVAFDPRWRTADTVGLARGIYEDRAFERMPLLRDALMDAGCADPGVLKHTRQPHHVRGCWVIDRILGKT